MVICLVAVSFLQALFLSLYTNFTEVLAGRLYDAFGDGTSQHTGEANEMTIDVEESSAMELDTDNGGPNKRCLSTFPFVFLRF